MRSNASHRLLLPMLLYIIVAAPLSLLGDNTLRGNRLKASGRNMYPLTAASPQPQPDTLRLPVSPTITVSGYDKPLRSYRETLLLTNGTEREVLSIALTIIYIDMQGRQLHQRTDTLTAKIPSGETRMVRMSSWDTQHSYYYHRGQRPRTANVTPYDISCRVEFITLKPEKND